MKLSLATLATVAVATEKKVPPRHPEQRLAKLRVFYDNFAADIVSERISAKTADRFQARMNSFLDNMSAAFNRPNCGYYDAESKHGGPDPNPNTKFNGKPRNRRDTPVDDDNYVDFDEQDARDFCDEYADTTQKAYCCGVDSEAYGPCDGPDAMKRSGANKGASAAYDRLASDPQLKWRQITTGTRKWAQRYINNCGGQRKNKHAVNRCKRVFKVWNEKLGF